MIDLLFSILLVGAGILIRTAYAARSAARGPSKFGRLESGGDSPLLGKPTMEAAYWTLAPVARGLARVGVSAHAVTGASLVLGAMAGVALVCGHLGVAAVLSATSALCDALDGFVARESGTQSEAGEIFDASVDRYNEFFFLFGLALLFGNSPLVLGLVLATLHGSFMVSYASARAGALNLSPPRGWMRRPERATYLTAGAALSPIAGAIAARFGGSATESAAVPVLAALVFVGIGTNISAVRRLLSIARLANERDLSMSHEFVSKPEVEQQPKPRPVPSWIERFARR